MDLLHFETLNSNWEKAWSNSYFKKKLILGLIIWVSILFFFPYFFHFIEQRNGNSINDILLNFLPAIDLSIPTFIIIWSMFALFMYRAYFNPTLFLVFLWGFIFLSISRIISIYLFPLNPPTKLIELKDPITNIFYGSRHAFITKDLFYSGHTSTQFLMALCFSKKRDKFLAFSSSAIIGLFVLIQHVHYSIDVLVAPIFTYLVFLLGKKIITI